MTAPTQGPGRARIHARTLRTDRWWLPPLLTFLGLSAFVIYGVIRAFMNQWYWVGEYQYLAPFYSPCLSEACVPGSSHWGRWFPDLGFLVTPPLFVLPFVLGFRLTCYYYRKAYYRAFWLSPPACAVAEPHRRYTGERRFPLILQNAHRYFFYAAIPIAAVLTYDVVIAFHGRDGGFGIGLGTLVLLANVVLIWAYTLSCHSCRHIVGGRLTHFSRHPVRYWMWTRISWLNARHMPLAWLSLFSVALADLYVMLVASGALADPRLFN
ncbi:hypothetical protein LX15_000448 [Streptoalloteichus tenebrarius]|uniref:Uncharacterized protein n=1 Tax=Streptoalloteichus tenebrarius (strain ATCC 17920 / DSM 40477 / JCM 4838 / CBS 697.72 / NBRC 16177 / NCIMB 11028 / NRRL B-12390 / A12253. 1 / ISP 5477) TaxID=1933 RepID=A0ABT1HMN8_STRSD|nr:hypothetical protein [Streptoalloteichus tenebrarius]MCP2256765.1 hypothetical protein [Streptoalloteichus tenebrarius]BFF00330.1 hypothetical protein GCM10020241_20050 [Streptoalloteichus tenebrarius]